MLFYVKKTRSNFSSCTFQCTPASYLPLQKLSFFSVISIINNIKSTKLFDKLPIPVVCFFSIFSLFICFLASPFIFFLVSPLVLYYFSCQPFRFVCFHVSPFVMYVFLSALSFSMFSCQPFRYVCFLVSPFVMYGFFSAL